MPNIKQAAKRMKTDEIRHLRNISLKSKMRTFTKKVTEAVGKGDKQTALDLLPQVFSIIDKAAKNRVIHPNAAARRKANLEKKVRNLSDD